MTGSTGDCVALGPHNYSCINSTYCRHPTPHPHRNALVDCLHGDLGGRIIAEVAKVDENAASDSYRGRRFMTSPSPRIVVVSRGRSRLEIASRLASITTPDFAIVRAANRQQPPCKCVV